MATAPTRALIREAPKVLLHDHLDGGMRPQTVIDLAAEQGYTELPTTDPGELAAWFVEGAARRSLPRYLEPFQHTVAVMQTAEALTRVARECAQDLADDGVVYAEVRFAPSCTWSATSSWTRWWRRCSPASRRSPRAVASRSACC